MPASTTPTGWAAVPEASDALILARTGRTWDEWVALIDAGPGRKAGHTAIATWVRDVQNVEGWWAQAVTVGYERIASIRLPGQMPDGSFTVSRSRTLAGDLEAFRSVLLDADARTGLFPGLRTTLRSKPSAKQLRFGVADEATGEAAGILAVAADPVPSGVRLVVTHEKLASVETAEAWKAFWGEWLAVLELS